MPRETTSPRKRIGIFVGAIVVIAIAVGIGYLLWQKNQRPPTLATASVKLRTMQRTIFSAGQVKPTNRQVIQATALTQPIKKLDVQVGQHVHAGQTLIELDDTQAQNAVNAAETSLSEANEAYARALQGYNQANSLLKQIWLPQVDAAQSEVAQAKTQLASAEAALSATKITANMSGTVLIANATGTDQSGNSTPIVEVVSEQKEIVMELSEVDAAQVKQGMAVTMTSDAFPNQKFHGKISAVAPYAATTSTGTGTIEVDASITGAFPVPLGYQVNCTISGATHKQVPTIPYSALVQEGTNYAVYVLAHQRVHLTTVQLGITNNTAVEVTSGLKRGQVVIVNPPANLHDGAVVSTG